jgi:hypothetical protein
MKKYIMLLVSSILLAVTCSAQIALYVAANGSGNAFSKQSPGNINELEIKLKQVNPNGGSLTIQLKQGFYFLKKTITINNGSIGGKYSRLLITGEPGARPTICGGRRITGWAPWKNGIYKASLPPGFLTRQLYFNVIPAIRARYPNRNNDRDFGPYFHIRRFDKSNKTIIVDLNDAKDFSTWTNLNEVELVINQHHYQNRIRIQKITRDGNELIITPREPEGGELFQRDQHSLLDDGKTFYFENVPEFVDQNNEFYDDDVSNTIYYKPAAGRISDYDTVIVPDIESLVKLSGTLNSPLSNITFSNLNLGYTTWLLPSRVGNIATVAVILEFVNRRYHIPGVIDAKYGSHIAIKNCSIFNAGGNGIVFEKAVKNSAIADSHLYYIAADGVYFDTFTFSRNVHLPDSIKCTGDSIVNNLAENEGYNYTNGVAFIVSCVSNTLIEHNEVRYMRHSGFQVGNPFGDTDAGVGNNVVRYNNVHDVLLLHDDGGGTAIYGNWIHDINKSAWADSFPINAIYLDAWSSYMNVHDNKFSNLSSVDLIKENSGILTRSHDNKIINNAVINLSNAGGSLPNVGPVKRRP